MDNNNNNNVRDSDNNNVVFTHMKVKVIADNNTSQVTTIKDSSGQDKVINNSFREVI